MKTILYHGTIEKHLDNILEKGLENTTQSPEWYMLADNFGSALFHSNADKKTQSIVLEIEIDLKEISFDRKKDIIFWKGYPQLYPELKHDEGYSWYAIKETIKPNQIKKVHRVDYKDFLKQKANSFNDLENYNTKVEKIKNKSNKPRFD